MSQAPVTLVLREWCFQIDLVELSLKNAANLSVPTGTKISILLLYRKISARSHSTWFIRFTWAAIAFTVVYTVALGLELVLVCRPFVSYWKSYSPEYTEKYKCGNEQVPIVFAAAASVFSDIYASVLPMLLVRNLNVTRAQRLGLYVLFSAGLLTAGIGVARLVFLVKVTTNYRLGPNTNDITWYGEFSLKPYRNSRDTCDMSQTSLF